MREQHQAQEPSPVGIRYDALGVPSRVVRETRDDDDKRHRPGENERREREAFRHGGSGFAELA